MQSSSGVTNEVAATGKATPACITEVSKSEFLISQDTTSLFLGKNTPQLGVQLSKCMPCLSILHALGALSEDKQLLIPDFTTLRQKFKPYLQFVHAPSRPNMQHVRVRSA